MRDFDTKFEQGEFEQRTSASDWATKARRFVRYLATRKMECWGFFAAGYLIATIF